jgi:hypothetical protein
LPCTLKWKLRAQEYVQISAEKAYCYNTKHSHCLRAYQAVTRLKSERISCKVGNEEEFRDSNQQMLWCFVHGGVWETGQGVHGGVWETGQGVHGGVWETGQGVHGGVWETGQGVHGGVWETGQGVQDGVSETGQGVQDGVWETGQGVQDDLWETGQRFAKSCSLHLQVKNTIYVYCVNCSWVATRWQQYSTHLQTNSTQNNTMIHRTQYTQNNIMIHRTKQ